MATLYITADKIAETTGGGLVTYHERQALQELGMPLTCLERATLDGPGPDPWKWDAVAYRKVTQRYSLAHFYAGTFGDTVRLLRRAFRTPVTYTAAAHDVAVSKREHEALGYAFNYPHLTEPHSWQRYLQPYKEADVLICPSTHSERVMRGFGCDQRIEVIPHGTELPETVAPLPADFTVGYLGSCAAPDKGVRFLLEAWGKLNYPDATLLLAGRDSVSQPVIEMVMRYCQHGQVRLCGWQQSVGDFYNLCSCYVQASATEGFGLEVLEAAACGRPVLCSDGAGAADIMPQGWQVFPACNAAELAERIDFMKKGCDLQAVGNEMRETAANYTWAKIRARYQDVWRGLL